MATTETAAAMAMAEVVTGLEVEEMDRAEVVTGLEVGDEAMSPA